MTPRPTETQHLVEEFRTFIETNIAPNAERYDREERLGPEVFKALANAGYMGATVPARWGGREMGILAFGWLNEELGRACGSARNLHTVHCMVAHAIARWGTQTQKERWLGALADGSVTTAFALTEPETGSDAASIETTAEPVNDSYILNGRKKWISFGQVATLFLVFAKVEGLASAFLVERNRPGIQVQPISGLLGLRASLLAEIAFDGCRIPADSLVGGVGFGINGVATAALEIGRYGTACGCVGMAEACLDDSVTYANSRRQFGKPLRDHQLIQRMIADMAVNVQAARLLCERAAKLKEEGYPEASIAMSTAKYFASRMCIEAAGDAVQIQGAHGCSSESAAGRRFRDARMMELIEGSTQVQQLLIAESVLNSWPRASAPPDSAEARAGTSGVR